MKDVDLGEPTYSWTTFLWVALKESAKLVMILWQTTEMCSNKGILLELKKIAVSEKSDANTSSWSHDMEGHAKKCVERHCELANKTTQQ